MDLVKLHDAALEATATIVANVGAAQFGDPTPCSEFDVRALLNHMIGGNYRFVKVAEGEPGQSVPATGDFVSDDALAAYRQSADAVSAAWSDPAVLSRTAVMPIGAVPGTFALGMHIVETVVHGFDLAKATGQPTEIDPELCAAAWEYTKDIDESFRGPGGPFGPAVAVPRGATDTDKLVAWLGRQP